MNANRKHKILLTISLFFMITVTLVGCGGGGGGGSGNGNSGGMVPVIPSIVGTFGSPVTFATHTALVGYGFSFGPSDGQFGAIPASGMTYTFYGSAGSTALCAGTPSVKGEFSFTGTLDNPAGAFR